VYDFLPCSICDEYNQVNTTVALCRCKHLSRFAVAYQQTNPSKGEGPTVGIYSDFFAMKYWRESFGFIAVIGGVTTYIVGLIICFFVDQRMQKKMISKIRMKVRKMEELNNRKKETLFGKRGGSK